MAKQQLSKIIIEPGTGFYEINIGKAYYQVQAGGPIEFAYGDINGLDAGDCFIADTGDTFVNLDTSKLNIKRNDKNTIILSVAQIV